MPLLTDKNREELETSGYTVVPGVLSEDDCQLYIQQYVDWIENNFDQGSFPYTRRGIIHGYSIGHLSPSWHVRLKTKPLFEELWGTRELLSSMDAVSIGRPPEQGEEEFHSSEHGHGQSQSQSQSQSSWLHVDHGAGRLGFHVYQGAAYLETTNKDDWVFECMIGSHKLLDQFYKEHPSQAEETVHRGNDFLRLGEDHMQWFRHKGCLCYRVPVPRGGVLLWDSRLVHHNARPIRGRANPDRWRFVVTVCMAPACWADKTSLRVKKRAYRELRMTSHWPSTGVRLFPPLPPEAPRAKHPLKSLPKVATTLEAMQMAGVVSYNKLRKKSQRQQQQQQEQQNGDARLGPDLTTPVPLFSPDYKPPPQPPSPSSSNCGWVLVALLSVAVCALSIYVYVYRLHADGPE
ncbi:uncharacterized protein LOC143287717 [Babylonia areolata]|uniref:uncharacterized protein LOC143287717 n=1 Tax=Babylonia areolata TaxID=304850 RepID=UPI003FD1FB37